MLITIITICLIATVLSLLGVRQRVENLEILLAAQAGRIADLQENDCALEDRIDTLERVSP